MAGPPAAGTDGAAAPPAAWPRRLWPVLRVVLAVTAVAFAAATLWRQWAEVSATDLRVDLRPGRIAAASALVLATYALLIETWRRTLGAWGARVPFAEASRVWNVSNLGKYVPGKVWQITAMAAMMRRQGVTLPVSGAAALVVTLANVIVGFALVLALGGRVLDGLPGGAGAVAALVALAALGLALTPVALPRIARALGRTTGRDLTAFQVPHRAVWVSAAGCLLAWLLYGVAFRWFAEGVLGTAPGGVIPYLVAYTGSYLVGYVALFAPGGIGVRELLLTTALPALGVATPPQAALLTVASRLWLTVLELVPGLVYLGLEARHRA